MAIGELKIVPNGTTLDGYIEYVPYSDITQYPKLVAKIGDTVLPPIGDYSTIGDLKLRLGKPITCDGTYFCWDYVSSNLYKFPEVKEHFTQFAENLDLTNPNRNIWLTALEMDHLPDISHRLISTFGHAREWTQMYSGQFFKTVPPQILAYPMVEHNENVLYPAGVNSKKPAVDVETSIPTCDKRLIHLESQYVLLAKRVEDLKLKDYPFMHSNIDATYSTGASEVGLYDENYVDPALSVQLLVNTRTGFSSVPEGFKLVIAISDAQDAATVADIDAITREVQGLKSRVITLENTPDNDTQADWNATDTASPAYIKNKPNLFDGKYSSLTGTPILFSGSYNDLSDKPTTVTISIPEIITRSVVYDDVRVPAGGIVNLQANVFENLPEGFKIIGFYQISKLKGSSVTDSDVTWQKVFIESFATTEGTTRPNVSFFNGGATDSIVKATFACTLMKTTEYTLLQLTNSQPVN